MLMGGVRAMSMDASLKERMESTETPPESRSFAWRMTVLAAKPEVYSNSTSPQESVAPFQRVSTEGEALVPKSPAPTRPVYSSVVARVSLRWRPSRATPLASLAVSFTSVLVALSAESSFLSIEKDTTGFVSMVHLELEERGSAAMPAEETNCPTAYPPS